MSRRRTLTHALLALFAAAVVALAAASAARAETAGVSKLVDPDTSARWEEVFGTGSGAVSTENAGRIWADKSVYASADDARAAGLPVKIDADDHSFIVGLSTLASAVSVRQEGGPAHDVVFVVSTNRLLEDITYGGRPQADYLVDALNQAIARLMAENGDGAAPTRVAVIGYDSKVTTLMPLGTYEPDGNGHYFAYDGGTLSVTATATDGAGRTASAQLGSGSYLQLATHVAGDVLAGAADDPGSEGRVPVLCLMGRETPPMASTNFTNPPVYTGDGTGFLGPLLGSRENGYGTDALLATLLTMRNEAARVNAAWGAKRPLTFFTCGLDTSETVAYLLETAPERRPARTCGTTSLRQRGRSPRPPRRARRTSRCTSLAPARAASWPRTSPSPARRACSAPPTTTRSRPLTTISPPAARPRSRGPLAPWWTARSAWSTRRRRRAAPATTAPAAAASPCPTRLAPAWRSRA